MIDDPRIRRLVARRLARVIDDLVRKHSVRRTQEPQLTSRIAEQLEALVIDIGLAPHVHGIRVIAQDFADRGPNSDESKSGIDVYVSIEVVQRGVRKSKGIVVQSKWPGRRDGLVGQCRKMLDRTEDAYVWIYEPSGTLVVYAEEVRDNPDVRPEDLNPRSAEDLFETILECAEGDPEIGIPESDDKEAALDDMIGRLSAEIGISASVRLRDEVR